jgi:phage gpG-like protein
VAASVGLSLFGDWKKAGKVLSDLPKEAHGIYQKALFREANHFRAEVVKGLRTGSPGGQAFEPLKKTTLAVRKKRGRGGTKPLIVSGDLRNGIIAKQEGDTAFVGILRTARGRGGERLANVAEVHEFGRRIVMELTPKARRFLLATFREAGILASGGGNTGSPGGGVTIVVINVPARPFLRPVFEAESKGSRERVENWVAEQFQQKFGI